MQKWLRAAFGAALTASLVMSAAQISVAAGGQMGQSGKKGVKKGQSLYDRLGKKEAITAVVDEFVANVAADTRINKFFASTDIPKLKMHLVNQICEASGGPCKYTGRSMKEAHKGMGISTADFNALVEDLVKALDKFKVGQKEKDELLGVLGPMKSDIVEKM
jgi:hemoglobin